MSKELPYFKFHSDEYLTGDITLCDWALQGIFVHICAYYWKRNCEVTLTKLKHRYSTVTENQWTQLLEIIKYDELSDKVSILFLDEQVEERAREYDKKSTIGKIGAERKWSNSRKRKEIFEEMKVFFDNKCVRCEGDSGLDKLQLDHIIPKYKGGIDDPTNWQPLCKTCNTSKGPEEIDWRLVYAKKYGKNIPEAWLCHKKNVTKSSYKDKDKDKDKDKEYSIGLENLYKAILEFFEEKFRPRTEKQKNDWLDTLDKCIRIDGYSPEQIETIVEKMRQDSFWSTNFMSVMKLRQTNKEKIKYIDVFYAKVFSQKQQPQSKVHTVASVAQEVMDDLERNRR